MLKDMRRKVLSSSAAAAARVIATMEVAGVVAGEATAGATGPAGAAGTAGVGATGAMEMSGVGGAEVDEEALAAMRASRNFFRIMRTVPPSMPKCKASKLCSPRYMM